MVPPQVQSVHRVLGVMLLVLLAYGTLKIPPSQFFLKTNYSNDLLFDAMSGANHPPAPAKIEWAEDASPSWHAYLTDRDSLKSPIPAHASFYKKNSNESDLTRLELNDIGRAYGIPDDVLYYQNYMESRGDCKAKSNRGAVGCFQFTRETALEFQLISKKGDFRRQFHASADAAARYMLWLTIVMYGESADPANWEQLRHVLAAYNAGYGTVTRTGKPEIPNFYETIKYVQTIEDLVKGKAVRVLKGDTLEDISARVGVPVETILRGNPIVTGDTDLVADTVLSLPDENGMSRFVVSRGMSLAKIQGATGVAVKDLMRVNQLKSKRIHPGLILQIPTTI